MFNTSIPLRNISWFSSFSPNTISSIKLRQFWQGDRIFWNIRWQISGAKLIPNVRGLYQNDPLCVMNVVLGRISSSSSNWWYAVVISRRGKNRFPFSLVIKLSNVGNGNFSRRISSFARRISIHILISLSVLNTNTIGEIHELGSVTRSMKLILRLALVLPWIPQQ